MDNDFIHTDISNDIKLIILYLQYDQKANPYTYVHIEKYLRKLKCNRTTIIISNQEKQLYNYGNDNIHYINGDNSSGEFSGWDKALQTLNANKIDYDVALFINDACLNPACYCDFDSIISDDAIERCNEFKTIVGAMCQAKPHTVINGIEIKEFIRTNCFLVSKSCLDKISLTSITDETINEVVNSNSALPLFKDNDIISEELKLSLIDTISLRRYILLDKYKDRKEFIRKIQGYLNEYLLTDKIVKTLERK